MCAVRWLNLWSALLVLGLTGCDGDDSQPFEPTHPRLPKGSDMTPGRCCDSITVVLPGP